MQTATSRKVFIVDDGEFVINTPGAFLTGMPEIRLNLQEEAR